MDVTTQQRMIAPVITVSTRPITPRKSLHPGRSFPSGTENYRDSPQSFQSSLGRHSPSVSLAGSFSSASWSQSSRSSSSSSSSHSQHRSNNTQHHHSHSHPHSQHTQQHPHHHSVRSNYQQQSQQQQLVPCDLSTATPMMSGNTLAAAMKLKDATLSNPSNDYWNTNNVTRTIDHNFLLPMETAAV